MKLTNLCSLLLFINCGFVMGQDGQSEPFLIQQPDYFQPDDNFQFQSGQNNDNNNNNNNQLVQEFPFLPPVQQQQQLQPIQQQQLQQLQPQQDIYDFSTYKQQELDTPLPTLPPLHIPPKTPVGSPPPLQSPITDFFKRPVQREQQRTQANNTFSLQSITDGLLTFLKNLNTNLNNFNRN